MERHTETGGVNYSTATSHRFGATACMEELRSPMLPDHDESVPLNEVERRWLSARPIVSAFVVSVLRDAEERDDLLQDVSLAVIESYPDYDQRRSFEAWAVGIAQRQLLRFLRTRRDRKIVFHEPTIEHVSAAFSEIETDQAVKAKYLGECLESLAGRSRLIFELRYKEHLDVIEVASRVNMKPDTVYKVLQRIRDQLQTCIESKTKLQDAKTASSLLISPSRTQSTQSAGI